MPFNISAFKSNGLVYGGARPSLFNVFMSTPAGLGLDNVSVDKFRFVCKTAELPESVISSIDVPYFGRKIKVAGERAFADWSVSVINDEDFSVRAMFEAWSNALNRLVSNVRDPAISAEQYKVDLDIVQYGKDGSTLRSYQLIGAFPTQISGIALSWESASAIEEFTVNFAYDYWIPLVESSDKKAGGVNVYGGLAQQDGVNGPA
jgi:hypothetical protein